MKMLKWIAVGALLLLVTLGGVSWGYSRGLKDAFFRSALMQLPTARMQRSCIDGLEPECVALYNRLWIYGLAMQLRVADLSRLDTVEQKYIRDFLAWEAGLEPPFPAKPGEAPAVIQP